MIFFHFIVVEEIMKKYDKNKEDQITWEEFQ